MRQDQDDVIEFLAAPAAYGAGCRRVERIDTHISVVFLAGERAFKLKRAVRLPYVDYSTLARRRAFCEQEVALNRRTAPDLYVGVVAVTRAATGALALGGDGIPCEWLVDMRRFDQNTLLDAVARRGTLDVEIGAAIGAAAAHLHAIAAPRHDCGGLASMQWVVEDNDAELSSAGEGISQVTRMRVRDAADNALRQDGALLDARRDAGWVRECHGDLHLGNIFLSDGRPVLFDGIEFNDALSCIDVLYDVSFLISDLLHRALPAHANRAMNAWLERLPHYDALALLPLFLSCRAAIRAKVLMTAAGGASDTTRAAALTREAGSYLDGALDLLAPGNGAIVAIGGLSGTGKSTLARRLAPDLGRAPGALLLRSDVARKRRFGVAPSARLPDAAYEASVTTQVYDELARSARSAARAGFVAVVDAVFASEEARRHIQAAAREEGVPFMGLWLEAPVVTMEERLTTRLDDASDATVSVLRQQRARITPPEDWAHIDASLPLADVAEVALASIAHLDSQW